MQLYFSLPNYLVIGYFLLFFCFFVSLEAKSKFYIILSFIYN